MTRSPYTDQPAVDKTDMDKLELTNSAGIKTRCDEAASIIDSKAKKKLLQKLDVVLIPMFTLIYCCNFIDRTSIGNAKIAGTHGLGLILGLFYDRSDVYNTTGLGKDLGMKGFDLNIALTVYYICVSGPSVNIG
ncbi:hypothetical protein BDQ17DRAFT_337241 [Cyathus striatus]|nr:hypothetical protein BDQ17DRAFT_337241 [Cyathus striatus]